MDETLKAQLLHEIEQAITADLEKNLERVLLARLCGATQWLSAQHAAAAIDVSTDSIERRAVPWDPDLPNNGYNEGKVRYKELGLNVGKKGDRRYYAPDVFELLKTPVCVRRSACRSHPRT